MMVCAGSVVIADRVLTSGSFLRICLPANGHRSHFCQADGHRQIDRVGAEPYAQGQFGMRAAAQGNQHVRDRIGQRTAHQCHVTGRARQHFGRSDVQRVELARPFEQQQVRLVGGDRFHQIGPRLM
jgi:hypothetical protein